MRELTEKEKKLCLELIKRDEQEQHQLLIGEVLLRLYGIEYFRKDTHGKVYQDSHFKTRIGCLSKKRKDIIEDLNEAISLLLMLKEKGMISFVYSNSDESIGDDTPISYPLGSPEHCDIPMMDYYESNSWHLLDSYYYISNSFKDYCRDFKSIEQRRHEKEMKSMRCTNIIAIITSVIALLTLLLSVHSCVRPNVSNNSTDQDTMSFTRQKTPKEIMADSVVSFSFRGFKLGKPLRPALIKAQKEKYIWNVNIKGNVTKGKTSILLLDSNKPLSVSITVETYLDTIYYIELKSDSDRAFSNIADVYREKYGYWYSYTRGKPDATYFTNNNKTYWWNFNNQRVSVHECDYIINTPDYNMLSQMKKEDIEFWLSQRDHSVYVYYVDNDFSNKAKVSDSIKREKKRVIEEKKQHVQDSINRIKEEKRKETVVKQI